MSVTKIWSPVPAALALSQCQEMIQDHLDQTIHDQKHTQGPLNWYPSSSHPEQQLFIFQNIAVTNNLSLLDKDEVEAIASVTADPINAFFAAKHLPIVLEPWSNPDSFGIGGYARFSHRNVQIAAGNYQIGFEAHRFDTERGSVAYYNSPFSPVGAVQMKNGDWLYYLDDTNTASTPYTLLYYVHHCLSQLTAVHYTGLVVPSWNIKENILDVSDLTNLYTVDAAGRKWSLKQPQAASKWVVNHLGSEFKAGFAAQMTLELCMSDREPEPGDLVFSDTLIAAIVRPGMTYPLAVARIDKADFCKKEPRLPRDDDSEF